jgi:hypothetical protein
MRIVPALGGSPAIKPGCHCNTTTAMSESETDDEDLSAPPGRKRKNGMEEGNERGNTEGNAEGTEGNTEGRNGSLEQVEPLSRGKRKRDSFASAVQETSSVQGVRVEWDDETDGTFKRPPTKAKPALKPKQKRKPKTSTTTGVGLQRRGVLVPKRARKNELDFGMSSETISLQQTRTLKSLFPPANSTILHTTHQNQSNSQTSRRKTQQNDPASTRHPLHQKKISSWHRAASSPPQSPNGCAITKSRA